jgi:anti-anti-sigma regulatory factor
MACGVHLLWRMLKVTTMDRKQTVTLKLEGRLAGPWVQEVTRVWADTACQERTYVVDLTSVTFIDNPGRALLETMSKRGAQFIATGCLTRNIVAEIQKEISL